ncbi:MAG: Alanine dehydrogenase, partial [uncultured Nocardioidaceae bacterium]
EDRCPEGDQEPRVPRRDDAGRGARARRPRSRRPHRGRRRDRLVDPRRAVRRGRRQARRLPGRGLGQRRDDPQGQGAGRGGVRPDARGPGALHLPPPRRRRAADPGARRPRGHRDRLRDRADPRPAAAAARADERGCRPARPAGRSAHAHAGAGRPRRAHGRSLRGVRREGRRHRRRRLGDERRDDRAGDAGRGAPARPRHRAAATGRPDLPGPHADRGVEPLRDRARGARRRPRHRRGARAGRQGTDAGLQRAGLPDEAGVGARRHLDRPGRLLRGLPPHDARRADVPGARLGLLLRGEHARRGAAHLDVRADQRDAALRRRARRQGLAAGMPRRRVARARAQHPRRAAHQRPRRAVARPGVHPARVRPL